MSGDGLKYVTQGEPLDISAAAWNSMTNAAQLVLKTKLGGGSSARYDPTVTLVRPDHAGPQYGLVAHVNTYIDDVMSVVQPTTADLTHFYVTAEPYESGDVISAWDMGAHPVLIDSTDYAAASVFDQCGPTASSNIAQLLTDGPLLILAKLGTVGANGLVLCRFINLGAGREDQTEQVLYEATADASGGTITAKQVNVDASLAGSNEIFYVVPDEYAGS